MVTKRAFGISEDGIPITAYTIANDRGIAVTVLDYGATLQSVMLPHRGGYTDIVLGYDTIEEYRKNDAYLGASIGRYAGRIPDAKLRIGESVFPVTANEGENHLHGGRNGFDKRVWDAQIGDDAVTFSLQSGNGDEGYPGAIRVSAAYALSENALSVTYRGVSDRVTAWNPTNHAYWNLNGHDAGDARSHRLELPADRYVPVGPDMIPIGGEADVFGTRFDFRKMREIGGAYDHSFVLNGGPIRLRGNSGIELEILTDCSAVQLYTAEFLSRRVGKGGAVYHPFGAVCLETQGRQAMRDRAVTEENILEQPGIAQTRKTTFRFLMRED